MRTHVLSDLPVPQRHGLLLGAIGPRPIAFASTIDAEGRPNLAPFSFFNCFGSNPPTLIFSPARRGRDNTTKHTYHNVEAVPEVVINVVETPEGYCDDCGLPCYGVKVDEGIGAYEFWGTKGIHHDYVYKSHCCDAEILDHNPCCSE